MNKEFLTLQGKEKLEQELDELRNERRPQVVERLHRAVEEGGDRMGEDAEYEAAKNEQAFVEGRIRELKDLLARARIIEENNNHDIVSIGACVTIQEEDFDPEQYSIVGAAEANPRDGLISNESPLGQAVLNRRVGETVTVEAPSGAFIVKILNIC